MTKSDTDQEKMVLVLQGGGALGAYQGGTYEALAAAGIQPDWVAGISIGAINCAIIAGNLPDRRVERLGLPPLGFRRGTKPTERALTHPRVNS